MDVHMPDEEIQVIAEVDVLIIGGSFAGIAAAVEFSKNGKKVMIVEPRTYLGRELTAVLRPWLEIRTDISLESLPELIQQV